MKHRFHDGEGDVRKVFFEVLAGSPLCSSSFMPTDDSGNSNTKQGENEEGSNIPQELIKRRTVVFTENQREIIQILQTRTLEILKQESLLTSDEVVKLMQFAALTREHCTIKDCTYDLYSHPRIQ